MPHPARIAAVVLAAGRSSRMGSINKLCCEIKGKPMVRYAVEAALGSRCIQTLVVTGHEATAVENAVRDCAVSWVHNPAYADGLSSSLRCGLQALPSEVDAALILLGDMPAVNAAHLNRLLESFDPTAPAIIVPAQANRRGNPVVWPRRYFAEMQALQGDQGARSLLDKYALESVSVTMEDEAIFLDVDTPEALSRFTEQTR